MRKKVVVSLIILLLLVTILNGCTDSSFDDKKKFVGTWMQITNPDWVHKNYTFLENGTFFIVGFPEEIGTWDAKDDVLTTFYLGVNASAYYAFSDNYRTLTLTGLNDPNDKLVLIKQTEQ